MGSGHGRLDYSMSKSKLGQWKEYERFFNDIRMIFMA
jgi:hypothetical protein